MRLHGFEQGLLAQTFTTLGLEGAKGRSPAGARHQVMGAKVPVEQVENFRFHRRNAAVIYLLHGTQRPQLGLEFGRSGHRARLLAFEEIGNRFHVQV